MKLLVHIRRKQEIFDYTYKRNVESHIPYRNISKECGIISIIDSYKNL